MPSRSVHKYISGRDSQSKNIIAEEVLGERGSAVHEGTVAKSAFSPILFSLFAINSDRYLMCSKHGWNYIFTRSKGPKFRDFGD